MLSVFDMWYILENLHHQCSSSFSGLLLRRLVTDFSRGSPPAPPVICEPRSSFFPSTMRLSSSEASVGAFFLSQLFDSALVATKIETAPLQTEDSLHLSLVIAPLSTFHCLTVHQLHLTYGSEGQTCLTTGETPHPGRGSGGAYVLLVSSKPSSFLSFWGQSPFKFCSHELRKWKVKIHIALHMCPSINTQEFNPVL